MSGLKLSQLRVIQAAIVFAPLAYGTVHPLPVALFQTTGFLLFGYWALDESRIRGDWGHLRDPLLLVGFAAILLGVFQLIPLPIGLLSILSPGTAHWANAHVAAAGIEPWALHPIAVVPWATGQSVLWLTALVAWFAVIQHQVRSRKKARTIIQTLAVTGLGLGLLGLFQTFTNASGIFWIGIERPNFYASFVNPNNAAGVLTLGAMACIAMALRAKREWRLVWAGCALLTAASAVFTLSRGGIGVLTFGLLFLGWRMWRLSHNDELSRRTDRLIPFVFGAALFGFLAWIGITEVVGELRSISADRDLNGRVPYWIDSVTRMWPAFPVFGIGFGNFVHVFPIYRSETALHTITALENEYLHALIEGGLIGAGLLVTALVILFRRIAHALRQVRKPGFTDPLAAGLLAVMAHMTLDFPLHLGGPALWILTVAAIVSARDRITKGVMENRGRESEKQATAN